MYNSLCRANKHGFDHRSYKQAYIACTPSHPRLPFTYQLCSSASIPASHHGNGSVAYCDFEIRKGESGKQKHGNMDPKNGGLEDDFPFQLDDV